MNKLTVFALLCAFALGACSPNAVSTNSTPDLVGTVNSIAETSQAQTLTAQPSPTPTLVPVIDTATPTLVVDVATNTTAPNTDTPQPNLTTTPATATSGPVNPNPTATFTPVAASGSVTLTPTLGVLTYGTLPPANRPYTQVTLVNKAKAQAYISLQVVTDQGYTIIEYPVKGTIKVSIPTGSYTYVAWVGGRQFVGYFTVSNNDQPTITLFKDKVTVNNGSVSYP